MMARTWLVTGGGNGLGREIVEAALEAGNNVVAGAQHLGELDAVVQRYGKQITPVNLDVRDEAAALKAAKATLARSPRFWSSLHRRKAYL